MVKKEGYKFDWKDLAILILIIWILTNSQNINNNVDFLNKAFGRIATLERADNYMETRIGNLERDIQQIEREIG